MIRCPWCGTSYTSFRPNCTNCGGPLPPLNNNALNDGAIPMPPPTPRPISNGYAFKLMGSSAGAIVGGVFALIGAIFGLVGLPLSISRVTMFVGLPFAIIGAALLIVGAILLYTRYQDAARVVRVLREGVPTEGRIVRLDEDMTTQINGRNPWHIQYEFRVNGNSYQGEVTTLQEPGDELQPRRLVRVLYLAGMPQVNSLYPHP